MPDDPPDLPPGFGNDAISQAMRENAKPAVTVEKLESLAASFDKDAASYRRYGAARRTAHVRAKREAEAVIFDQCAKRLRSLFKP